jgi:hypothetical protein
LQNIKFQAPNPNEIPNFHPVESCLWQVRQRRNSTGQVSKHKRRFGIFNFGHFDLFGICDLLFGIFSRSNVP